MHTYAFTFERKYRTGMTISRRLYLILAVVALLIAAELTALWFTIHTLSAVRAYVGGEGLWSKAEKDAVYQLEAYGRTRDPRNYRAYVGLLSVSLGDRQARLEMAKATPDKHKEFQGFLQGRNERSDIPGMIALFQRFHQVSYISQAIADWTQADVLMVRIRTLAERLHEQVQSGQPRSTIDRTLSEIGRVNQNLTAIEDHFSYTLGEGSRWLTGLVLRILVGAALTVELSGLFLTASVTGGISKRLNAMLEATDRISKGDYRVSLETNTKDELGRLSLALNKMAGDIAREQARAESAVRVSETALREAHRVAHIGSWEWDMRADAFTWSKEFRRLCEVPSNCDHPSYADFVELTHPADRLHVDKAIQASRTSGEPFTVDHRLASPSEAGRWLCTQGAIECDTGDRGVRMIGTTIDVTDRKLAEERLAYLAEHDPLTDLPNRLLLVDRLRQAIAKTHRDDSFGALFYVDLDHFKDLNDTLGHAAGDRLLVSVGERLKASIRGVDTVARSGGDEFLIVLSDLASSDAAAVVAKTVLRALSQPFSVDGHEMFVTASIGISQFPTDGVDVETLIRDADTAMYQAKKHGRNKYQFYGPNMHEQAVKMLSLHNELRRALENEEFVIQYQPIIELSSGALTGVEALLRWRHPSKGMLMPSEFIGAAEDNGTIVPIGDWVLRETCKQIRRWRDAGFDNLRMTVNVSALQLNQPDFLLTVADAVLAAGVDPRALDLEITETAVMIDPERAIGMLSELRGMGIRISLDDFGTGYNSLGYLKRLPIDGIKIDRSFVDDIATDTFDTAITESIVSLCHHVGLRVTAEGVETRAQLELLQDLGCDEIQGFCVSAALEPSRFEEMARCWTECWTESPSVRPRFNRGSARRAWDPKAVASHQTASRSSDRE
jgi:diguanylate cyclase (GGDEF)-like protein